jgi:hypothetical protein
MNSLKLIRLMIYLVVRFHFPWYITDAIELPWGNGLSGLKMERINGIVVGYLKIITRWAILKGVCCAIELPLARLLWEGADRLSRYFVVTSECSILIRWCDWRDRQPVKYKFAKKVEILTRSYTSL